MALAALGGVKAAEVERGLAVARQFLAECRSADALNWLRLGLLAHGQLPAGYYPPRGRPAGPRPRPRWACCWPPPIAASCWRREPPEHAHEGAPPDHAARTAGGLRGGRWRPAAIAPTRRPRRRRVPARPARTRDGLHHARPGLRPDALRHDARAFWPSTAWTCAAARAAQAQPGGIRTGQHHQHASPGGARRHGSLSRHGRGGGAHRRGSRPPPQHAGPGGCRRLLPDRAEIRRPLRRPESGRGHAGAPGTALLAPGQAVPAQLGPGRGPAGLHCQN